ncbi:hypothetical protein J4212_02350 [Candidatus Woesearchaeota archaeon]|nr:hypothetical protein [Candidatus Woesearchaeota archaeon]
MSLQKILEKGKMPDNAFFERLRKIFSRREIAVRVSEQFVRFHNPQSFGLITQLRREVSKALS